MLHSTFPAASTSVQGNVIPTIQSTQPFDFTAAKKILDSLKTDFEKATTLSIQKDALRIQIARGYEALGDAYRDKHQLNKARASYTAITPYDVTLAKTCLQKLPPVMPGMQDTSLISTEWRNRVVEIGHFITQAFKSTSNSKVPAAGPFFPVNIQLTKHVLPKASAVDAVHKVDDLHILVASLNSFNGEARRPFYKFAEEIVAKFEEKPPSLERIQELVILATVPDRGLYQQIMGQLLKALREDRNPILYAEVAQGLAVIIEHPPEQLDLTHNPELWVNILSALQTCLSTIYLENNAKQLMPMLQAICSVLDAMVWNRVTGLERKVICQQLQDALGRVKNHADVTIDFQGRYACQALAYLGNDESLAGSIARHSVQITLGVVSTSQAILNQDPEKFLSSFESFFNAASNIQLKFAWYKGLLYIDTLLRLQDITRFEQFVCKSKLARDPSFLQGVSLRIEQILLTQKEAAIRKGALDFLERLAHPSQDKYVRKSAQAALQRLRGIPASVPSTVSQLMRPAINWAVVGANAQTLQAVAFSHHATLPPVWEPLWYVSEHQELLESVKQKAQRAQVIYTLSTTVQQTVELGMQLGMQRIEAQLEAITLQNTDTRNQPIVQLGESIDGLKDAYLKTLKDIDSIKDALTHYIPPDGQESAEAKESFVLMEKIEAFFHSNKKVLLLLGEAGSGKSTFARFLARALWEARTAEDMPIPIFIALAECPPFGGDLVENYLRKQGFEQKTIDALRAKRFIFILDGFDEIQHRSQAFYTQNKLDQWDAHIIVSSRPEYLEEGYRSQFQKRGQFNALQEYWLAPISDDWAEKYIQKYCREAGRTVVGWDSDRYQAALNDLPTLKEAIRRPFLLRMALEILPTLRTDNEAAPITRITLYDKFLLLWWERSLDRLKHIELTKDEKTALKRLSANFSAKGLRASQEMAFALTKAQKIQAFYDVESDHAFPEAWRVYVANPTEEARLLFFNAPLIRDNQSYRFLHKSIQDYLVARAICGPKFKHYASDSNKLDLNAVLNQLLLVKEALILDFLVERVEQQPAFKAYLQEWIEASKDPHALVTVGAANAITILIRAGVQFNGADLQGIRIPGADLSFGVFDYAQLQGADLSQANLRNIWLRQANLSGAKMEGVQFGEWPFLKGDSAVTTCTYSPNGETCAAGFENGTINVYDTSNWERIHVLNGHAESVSSVVYSPNSERIASYSYGSNIVQLWDAKNGQLIRSLNGHTEPVVSLVYSPINEQIASGSKDCTVRLWDTQSGNLDYILEGNVYPVVSLAYSPDGKQLVCSSKDNTKIGRRDREELDSDSENYTVQQWDAQSGQLLRTLKGHADFVSYVAYSPNGKQIAAGSELSTVQLWDAQSGQSLHTLRTYWGERAVYSPTGEQMASRAVDDVKLWDAKTGRLIRTLKHPDSVWSVAYSRNGKQIASGNRDHSVRLWDAQTGDLLHTLNGHTHPVYSVRYSPNGEQIASYGEDGIVRLWDAQPGQSKHTANGHTKQVYSAVYSPTREQIASCSMDNTVRLWDAQSGQLLHTLSGHTEVVWSMTYSPDGEQLASCSFDASIRLWDAQTGRLIRTLTGHNDKVYSVVYSLDGKQIASGSYDNTVRLWDTQTGELIRTLTGHTNWVEQVRYSPNGKQIASRPYGDNGKIRLWDAESGQLSYTLSKPSGTYWDPMASPYIWDFVYSPNGDHIAFCAEDGTVQLFDAQSGQFIQTLKGQAGSILKVEYSPDGQKIASASRATDDSGSSIELWDVQTGQLLHTLKGHTKGSNINISSIVYSPDGTQLVSSSHDGTVRLWDIASGQPLVVIDGFYGGATNVAWKKTQDGNYLVTSGSDKSVRLWQVIEESGRYHVRLNWSSTHSALTLTDASIQGVQGLSQINEKLLKQRGAIGELAS